MQHSHPVPETKATKQASHDSQSDQPNNSTEDPVPDSSSAAVSSSDGRKVSREDIELVSQSFDLSVLG